MVVVLKHGVIELVFLGSAARIQALSPVFSVRAAENPAAVILGFKTYIPVSCSIITSISVVFSSDFGT